uniref:Uncharacterized protein n=1 Tax=Fagus sylvatica TaxID=28930 RepID=A0A2N9IZ75_FAGSY
MNGLSDSNKGYDKDYLRVSGEWFTGGYSDPSKIENRQEVSRHRVGEKSSIDQYLHRPKRRTKISSPASERRVKGRGELKGAGAGKKLKKPTIDATAPEIPVQPLVEQEPPLPPPVVHDLNEPEQGEEQQPRKERGRTETPFVQSEGSSSRTN